MSKGKNKSLDEIAELAKAVGLPHKSTKEVFQYLKHDILLSIYRDPEIYCNENSPKFHQRHVDLNKKIEDVYMTRYGRKFNYKIHSKNKRLPLFLFGIPGQGKTAVYHAAAKETATELGLNFISHVTDSYVPSHDDFVMVVQECAGENSAVTFGGVPKAEEITLENGEKVSVLKKAVNYRFTVFDRCAGGVLLFDDAANAPSVIQNVLLPVAQNGTFQGLHIPNACIGFTGNLGALDGTYVTELSTALITRVVPMFVTDNLKDFLYRGYNYYNDELGDLGLFAFLERNEGSFAGLPESGQKSGFPCSRSYDNFIQSVRSLVEWNGGRDGLGSCLSEIHSLAYSTLGREVGMQVVAYYDSYIRGADPLARLFVKEGKPDLEKLREKYEGGASSDSLSFGTQFAGACADYAIGMLSQDEDIDYQSSKFENIVTRFGSAILNLNGTEFSYGVEHFKSKLAVYAPNYSVPSKESKFELKSEVRTQIAEIINGIESCDASKREALISVITDHDKIDNVNGLGTKGTGTATRRKKITSA